MSDSELNLLYTDVEDSLRDTVRALLNAYGEPARVLACYDGDRSIVSDLWDRLTRDLGLGGLLIDERYGGAGGSAREAAVVLEELGRAVAPVPFLTSAVIATKLLSGAATHSAGPSRDRARSLLADHAAGIANSALAVPFAADRVVATVEISSSDAAGLTTHLTGGIRNVAGALESDVLLVPVAVPDGVEVYGVNVADVLVDGVSSLDMTRQVADLSLVDAPAHRLLDTNAASSALKDGLGLGAALLASEQVGIAQWCLDYTVDYLKQRRQFGRVVGGFQALKHRLADLYVRVEMARAVARYAAAAAATDDADLQVATGLAQAYCSDVAVDAAEECVQLLGGLGMTWEHPAHLYLKRAKADQIALGGPGAHRAALADLIDLPAAEVSGVSS